MPIIPILALLLAAGICALPGCSQTTLEEMMVLADQDDPDQVRVTGAAPKKPVDKSCKVQAFQLYCLGGDIQRLLNTREPIQQEIGDTTSSYVFRDKYWVTTVTAFKGKIVRVSRQERPASWRTLEVVRVRLENNYGLSEDRSSFPAGVEDPKGQMQAIFAGQGQFLYEWERPKWRLNMRWDNMRFISVIFVDKELDQDSQAGLQ